MALPVASPLAWKGYNGGPKMKETGQESMFFSKTYQSNLSIRVVLRGLLRLTKQGDKSP
jgi:hypothetical protein